MDSALAYEVEEISRHRIINETIAKGNSDVQRFYENKVIFITGGSGFLGKQLIEKLLRSCNLKMIYMLMRPKKQKTINERVTETFNDTVYDVLKTLKPNFTNKIVPVLGDVEQLNIGLSEEDRNMLIEDVDIIFHVAATTNFADPIKKATLTNIRGTREVLNLGEACKHLKAFIHVSTVYTPATYSRIGQEVVEKFYPAPVSPEGLIQFAETLDETKLDNMTPTLIKDWPNTYTFTKRVAEELIRQREGKMPMAVIRPGIVIGAYREPSPGWIDKSAMFSASGFILGSGLGILHVSISDVNTKIGYVPVDMVNNATIIAGFDTNKRWIKGQTEIKIHAIINNRNPIHIKDTQKIIEEERNNIVTEKAVYYPFYITTSYEFVYYILTWILHFIPGYIVDVILLLIGKQPILSKIYRKVYKLNGVVGYFMRNDWKFNDDNLLNMYQSLSPNDRIIYNCDMAEINWKRYMIIWAIGIRKYIVKDGLKNTNYARKKDFYLRIIHFIITPLYLYSLWKIFVLFLFIVSAVYSLFTSLVKHYIL